MLLLVAGCAGTPLTDAGADTPSADAPGDASVCNLTSSGDTRLSDAIGITYSAQRTVLGDGSGSVDWFLPGGTETLEVRVLSVTGCEAQVRVFEHHRGDVSDDFDPSPTTHDVTCTRVDGLRADSGRLVGPTLGLVCERYAPDSLVDGAYREVDFAIGGDLNDPDTLRVADLFVRFETGFANVTLFPYGR